MMKRSVVRITSALCIVLILVTSAFLYLYCVNKDNTVYAANTPLRVKSVKYSHTKSTVKFKFNQKVEYKYPWVTIRYKGGRNMVTKIKTKKSDYLTVKVKKLKYGRKYTYTITGVRKPKTKTFVILRGTFRAVD